MCLQVFNRSGLFDSGHTDHIQGTRERVGTLAGHTGEISFLHLCLYLFFLYIYIVPLKKKAFFNVYHQTHVSLKSANLTFKKKCQIQGSQGAGA